MMRLLSALCLGAAAAALVLTNLVLYETPVDISPLSPSQRSTPKAAAAGSSETVPDVAAFSETFERPLFSPTRRKFVPAPVEQKPIAVAAKPVSQPEPQPAAAPVAAPSLLGVSINGGTARALLQAAGGGAAVWYASGETVDGWTVSAIDRDQAILRREGQEARISLYPATTAGGGHAP